MTFSKSDLSIQTYKVDSEPSLLLSRLLSQSARDQKTLFYFWQVLGIVLLTAHFALIFACSQSIKLFPLLTLISVAFSLKYGMKALYGGMCSVIAIASFNAYFETFSLWNVLFATSTLLSHFALYGCFKETYTIYSATVLFSEKCREEQSRLIDQMREHELERLQERDEFILEIERIKQEAELRKLEKNTLDRLLENAKGEILSFNAQKERVIREMKESRAALNTLQKENDGLNSKVNELNSALESSQNSANETLKSEIERLSEEKHHVDELLMNAQNQLNHYKQALKDLEDDKSQTLLTKTQLESQCQLLQDRCLQLSNSLIDKVDRSDYIGLKTQYENLSEEIVKLNSQLEEKGIEIDHYRGGLHEEKLKEAALIQERNNLESLYHEKITLLQKDLVAKDLQIEKIEKVISDYKEQLEHKNTLFGLEKERLFQEAQKEIALFTELKNELESHLLSLVHEKESLVKQLEEKNQGFEDLDKQKKQLSGLLNQLRSQFEEKNRALSEARQERYLFETQYLLLLQEKKLEQHSQNVLWKSFDALEQHYSKEREELLNEISLLEETISSLMNSP